MRVDHSGFRAALAGDELPQDMRSTVLLYPALLHRLGRITIRSNAKGCSLGVREIDPHLDILRALGAEITDGEPLAIALPDGLPRRPALARLHVGHRDGKFRHGGRAGQGPVDPDQRRERAARPGPLRRAGRDGREDRAASARAGSRSPASNKLHGATIAISTDYHEVVTFLALGAITGGEVRVEKSLPHHFDLITRAFAKLGVTVEHEGDTAIVRRGQKLAIEKPYTRNLLPKIEAAPWPYFSVDLLPLMIALSTRAEGTIHFWNKVYENGFSWMPELAKFGAHVVVSDPHRIIVFGNRPLRAGGRRLALRHPRRRRALTMVAASHPRPQRRAQRRDHQARPPALRREPPLPRRRTGMEYERNAWSEDAEFGAKQNEPWFHRTHLLAFLGFVLRV